jgi:RNA polymerase sigma-70 factor, ECF subfamily
MAKTTLITTTNREGRFNDLMKQTHKKVYNMAFRLAGNRADAEDLTQEAYYRAYRSFGDYQGDKPFENWIFRIVSRLFLDLLRSRRRRIQAVSYDAPLSTGNADDTIYFDVPDQGETPESRLLNRSYNEDLQMVLESLTEEQRTLILLADVEQVPYTEIAEMMGKPIGTIRSRLHRTHKMMRDRLERLRKTRESKAEGALSACPTG